MSFASDKGHFYQKDGTPAYEQPNKSKPGEFRKTTIRDARKLNLVPSVTTILNVLAKPGLERWKMEQVLMSALTLPKVDGESLDEYANRIRQDSAEQAKQSAEIGTEIHGAIENYYVTGRIESHHEIVQEVANTVYNHYGDKKWNLEKSFACHLGYAGKVDLSTPGIVLDIKTKDFGVPEINKKKVKGYEEQCMQLAAYRVGLGYHDAKCANVFVSRNFPGLVHIHEWKEEELQKGITMFHHTLKIWEAQKNYSAG